jgi:glycosyltransferase involved in cell wall biosynthesis
VIVVDDGSTDNSRDVLSEYADKAIVICQQNRGQGGAINAGFARSSGELILFLDSDDFLAPDTIEVAVRHWQSGLSKLQFPLAITNCVGETTGALNPTGSLPTGDLVAEILREGSYPCSPTTGNLFDRQYLRNVLPMSAEEWKRGADGYLVYSAPFFGRVKSVNEPLAFYRAHSNSATNMAGLKALDPSRLTKLLGDDDRRLKLLRELALSRGLTVSDTAVTKTWCHLKLRLAAAKLGHEHPAFEHVSALSLTARAVVAACCSRRTNLVAKVIQTAWVLIVSAAPRPWLPVLLTQGFNAAERPEWMQRFF